MRTFIFVTLILCSTSFSYSQVVKDANARLFSIVDKGDTIQFLKTDTGTVQKKPTIIFCQGSLPIPLIIDLGSTKFIPALNNFNFRKLSGRYNIILISMPHTPVVVAKEKLNKRYQYVPDLKHEFRFDSLYLRDNYLDKYVERANSVLKYLLKQKWVDKDRIAVFGHSQGSYIALELAKQNSSILAAGYSGGNPSGRFSLNIRKVRRDVLSKKLTPAEGQQKIEGYYELWKSYCKGINPAVDTSDGAKTWTSFTVPLWDDLIRLKTPLFIAYGTEDLESAESCELLPVYFEKAGKTNYRMMPMVSCGHNFEEISPEGISDYEKMHWDDVMNGFVEWFDKL